MAQLIMRRGFQAVDFLKELSASLTESFAKYREYREVLSQLRALNQRELSDLGLSSQSPEIIAYQAVYGDAS